MLRAPTATIRGVPSNRHLLRCASGLLDHHAGKVRLVFGLETSAAPTAWTTYPPDWTGYAAALRAAQRRSRPDESLIGQVRTGLFPGGRRIRTLRPTPRGRDVQRFLAASTPQEDVHWWVRTCGARLGCTDDVAAEVLAQYVRRLGLRTGREYLMLSPGPTSRQC
jgi:hypothetical protein